MKILKYNQFLYKLNEDTQNNVLNSIEGNSLEKTKKTVSDHNAHKSILTSIFRDLKKTDEQVIKELIKLFKNWYKKDPSNDSAKAGSVNALSKNDWSSILIYNDLDDLLFQVLKTERDLKKLELQNQNRQDLINTETASTNPTTKEISNQRAEREKEEISKTKPLSDELAKNVSKLKGEIEKAKAKYLQKQKDIQDLENKKQKAAPEA